MSFRKRKLSSFFIEFEGKFVLAALFFTFLAENRKFFGAMAKDNLIVVDNENEFNPLPSLGAPCGVDEYACKDLLKCIPKGKVCDLSPDCHDGSDEPADCAEVHKALDANAMQIHAFYSYISGQRSRRKLIIELDHPSDLVYLPSYVTCHQGQFRCKLSGRCIPLGWQCDGAPDCGFAEGHLLDLSDEEKCKVGNPCSSNQMKCHDGFTCKPISDFCDGYPDCPDASDEHEFCGNASICNNSLHCNYGCKPSEKGPVCYCPVGKEFTGSECIDSNECLMEGACDHICTPNGTKKVCRCIQGYDLVGGIHCKALNVPEGIPPLLIHQDSTEIQWIHINGSSVENFPSYKSETHVALLGLTFSHFNSTVCWINHNNITSTLRCGKSGDLREYWDNPSPYLYSLEDVYEIAYDWISWNFYFVDDGRELIFMCGYSLNSCTSVVDFDVSKPRGLALDPTQGFMFFTVWGRSGPKLERAFLDGFNRTQLVTQKIVYPFGITVDLPLRHVYWVDKYLDSIERIDYDGRNRRTIYSDMQQLHDVTIFENNLFVITWQENNINKLDKFEPSNCTTLVKNLTKPFSLQVFHRAKQPNGHNYCLNRKCPYLCFTMRVAPFSRCACPEGLVLKDGKHCVYHEYSEFLIYTKMRPASGIKSLSLKTNDTNVMIPVVDKYFYSSFDYDSAKSTIYYSDTTNFRLMKKSLNNVTSEIFLEKGISHSDGIAIDWIGRNLYWTDENLKVIYVANLDDSNQKKLLISADFPKSIVVDPERGYMYWSNWARGSEKDGWIAQAWMNGKETKKIVTDLVWPLGLTIDIKYQLLYWSDSHQFTIERISLNNTNSRQLIYKANPSESGRLLGMSFFRNVLYLTVPGKILKVKVPLWPNVPIVDEIQFETILEEEVSQIKVYDPSLQEGRNKCSGDHGCPEFCFALPEKPFSACSCKDGFKLSEDAKSCIQISNYTHPLACNASQFECTKFPKCVPDKKVCDGTDDCADGSDELASQDGVCVYEPGHCGRNSFHCGGRICIPHRFVCNGKADCQDGSDEKVNLCSNSSAECTEFEFQCQVSKRCIPKTWTCDHEPDCGANDTSDEHTNCEYPECTLLQFKCKNKFCIPLENVCDGIQDCSDATDEQECEVYCNRTSKMFCRVDTKCLESKEICDGSCQCSDGSDETNCPGKLEPDCVRRSERYFPDSKCSLESWVDGYVDIITCQNITCGRNTWSCIDSPNSQCIPQTWRCDGTKDCNDGSDESGCPTKIPQCTFPSKLCDGNTRCIGVNQLCNDVRDCTDGSDEGSFCLEKQCETIKKAHNCSDHCHNSPEGHVCYCGENRHLTADLSKCVDKHPCDQWGRCSQICKHVNKRFRCLCFPGYELQEDGSTCKSLDQVIPYLVFSNRHELRGVNLRTVQFNSLISNLRNSIALDFYYAENSSVIFWTDVVDDRIYKGNLVSGSLINIDVVIQTGLATAEGLAVDWIGENLYWVESNLDQIEVAKLNGSFRKTLISGEMVSPRSIAVDPREGVLFWSDWEADAPRIEKASMSGDLREIVIRVGLNNDGAWPNGLTLDYDLQRIYWVDARLDSIHTIKYDGSDFQNVLEKHEALSHPFAITIFENELFWTDWLSNSVMRANKFNGSNVTTIHRTYTQPFDVKIIHPSRQQKNIKNPCGINNGKCSHLCLLNYNSTSKCGCPHLMIIGPDNHACIAYEKMLIFSRLNEIRAVYLDKPYYHAAPPISLNLIVNPANLHYVAKYKQIYWCDTQLGETKRANLTTPVINTLIDAAAGKPLAIGVDWISNLIFVAVQNPLRNSISVVDLEGQFFTTIIQGKNDLRGVNSIAVNPYKGLLFWPDGNAKNQFTIQMAQMDGTNRVILSNSRTNSDLDSPVSLSYDFKSDRLYWVNYQTVKIQYYDFGKKIVKTISFGDLRPTVITVYENYIYFASDKQDSILKGDKTIGNEYFVVRNSTENIYSMRVYDPEEQTGTNPCAVNKGGCEHLCLPVSTVKRVCKCALGYQIDDRDGTKCKGIDPVLLYADSTGIKGISPQFESIDDLLIPIPLVSSATDIDVDERKSYLYWLDNEKGRISRIKRDGTSKEVVLTGLDSVIGLAIDWSAGNMYWANPKESMIEIAHVNGSSRYVLITNDLDKPMSLALDPVKGFLFWNDVSKGRIERSLLDGTNRAVIVQKDNNIMRVADITLDLENSRIYWCDSTADKIESCNYDGSDLRVVYSGEPESQLHSPVISYGQLYWIDMGHMSGSIMTAPITANGNFTQLQVQTVRKNLGVTLKDLSIFSKGRQNKKNLCGKNNGGCEDLCLFNGTNGVCWCAHGKIGLDGKSCEPYDAFLVFSRVQSIETVHVTQNQTPNSPYKPIQSAEHIRNAVGLAFDLNRYTLFYSDVQLGTINSVFFNGTNFTVIAEKQGSVEGLYFEASHNDLYWTCSNDASINRFNPQQSTALGRRGKVQKILKLNSNDRPRGLAVDPCESRIYWTNWDNNRPSIQRSFMSGFHVESIITSDIRMPNGLTLDHTTKKLYWVDARLDKIERSDFDGRNRKVIGKDKPKHAFAIAVYGDYLYWTDWVLLSVLRANKYNGEDVVVLRKDIPKPMGIVAVSNQTQSCIGDPCKIQNGGCSDICQLDEYGKVKCHCRSEKILLEGGRCGLVPTTLKKCGKEDFQCSSGVCIPYPLTCDGTAHCPDRSDEDETYCSVRECKEGFFSCPLSRCIALSKLCDGQNDCGDLSDEASCNCTLSQFSCGDGRCINDTLRCDYHPDCTDASDEMNCPDRVCPRSPVDSQINFFQCAKTTACIHRSWTCDGQNDCWDGSDEQNCTSIHGLSEDGRKKSECQQNSFFCKDGQCILPSWKCDNDRDCEDGEDEKDCQYTCGPGQFLCKSGECISRSWHCDGSSDCVDSSDETPECGNRTCEETQFKCNTTGRCIPVEWLCDGDDDCGGDRSDENPPQGCANLTRVTVLGVCSPNQFQCPDGLCIIKEYYCDRDDDCGDRSDEPESCHYKRCDNSSFICDNGHCISKNSTCNGLNDCGDNSDEAARLCGRENYCSEVDEFLCKNNACVNESKLCNGENDCGDFSDELECNINECNQPGTCQHLCVDKKVGYKCECNPGYKVNPFDSNLCIDHDECFQRPCSQVCRNLQGSYICSCKDGYILKHDLHSCKSTSSEPVRLMFSNQYYVRLVNMELQETLVAQNLTNAVALDYDWEESCIYWSDVTAFGSSIKRLCNIFSSETNTEQTLHHITVQSPDGLAVDWVGKNLYWCDKGTDTIEVSKLDGTYRKVLISDGLQEPRAIALDPFHGYMYWTDWGDTPHIGKAGMDGSNVTLLILDNLGWPNALTISYETEEIFWADAREDYIAVADLNGKNRKVIHSRVSNPGAKVHHIFAISVFEDWVYWSDWETKSVEKCHKYTGLNQSTVTRTIHRPMDVKVYHPDRQPQVQSNPCENNGDCPTLCLLTPGGGRVCQCPENFILTPDGKMCKHNCTSSQFVCKNTFKCIPFWWSCDKQDDCGDNSDEPPGCPDFKCTPGQYQCKGGEDCIHPAQLCDGRIDCKNGTDELDCDKHTCFSTQFKCEGNGTIPSVCIHRYKQCDGVNDCVLHQDEVNCLPQTCPKNQFKCTNGKCVQTEWVCDEEDDCGDRSDEFENCTQRVCEDTKFRCRSGKCIPSHWRCDGEKDCTQGEDEPDECSKQEAHQCDPTYFKCANHKCIPGRWRCDYDNDCEDNSDEIDCIPRNCSESEVRCGDGRCIRGNYRCNGEYNCEDHSDELGCNSTCSSQEFTCKHPQFCIANGWVCDGDLDCLDGTDEMNCSKQVCHTDQFMCLNGECISNTWRCDGERDCTDGSDENFVRCANHTCEPGRFRCRNNICIPYRKACDEVNDCSDGSDEIRAMCIGKLGCPTGEFQCSNKGCISSSLVCDGYNDCVDNSDEVDCAPCPFAACSHSCLVKKQFHSNTRHNFSCECSLGYALTQFGNSTYCAAKGEAAFMLVASENELKRMNPQKPYGNETARYLSPNENSNNAKIESVDYFIDADGAVRIFWTSLTLKTIQSMYQPFKTTLRSKRGVEDVVNVVTGLDEPRGIDVCDTIEHNNPYRESLEFIYQYNSLIFWLGSGSDCGVWGAVDWIAKRIYWVDAGQDTVSVSTVDGKNRMVLINKDLSEPHDIAVDPDSGRMFWSDWIDQRIDVAKMDGTSRRTLATSPCPSGLAVDYPAKRLYWTDVKSHSVESSTLDGKDRRVIKRLTGGEFKPYRIDVFEDTLFLTTYQSNRILKMNKFGKGNFTEISQGLQKASDILIIQANKQRLNRNPCDDVVCMAPGICLLNGPNSTNCVCPNGRPSVKTNVSTFECNITTGAACDLNCKQGHCKVGSNGPFCHCNPLYEGVRCEKYLCSGHCKNKGLCYQDLVTNVHNDALVPLKCNCPPDWTGERCESPFSSCRTKCQNGGTCNEKTNVCNCSEGYAGRYCEKCEGFECENGGSCVKDETPKMRCACPSGYSGLRCETSKCMNYCHNKGKCKIKDDIPDCTCAPGYGGPTCTTDLCDGLCRNGGKCLRRPGGGVSCSCLKPFTGPHCENNPCDCVKNKCKPDDKSCQCPPLDIAECSNSSSKVVQCPKDLCTHGGTCEIIKNNTLCRCTDSWVGLRCEVHSPRKNPCQSYCLHSGVCVLPTTNEKPMCVCSPEWSGGRCQTKNTCQNFCWNGGTCILNPDSSLEPTCKCLEKFSGTRCQTREDHIRVAQGVIDDEDVGITWIIVLVFIVVAVAIAGFSGCAAYFVMKRKQGRPFLHVRMHDNGTVEINNPMFLKEEGDDDHASEPSLIFDSDKGTNFANPVYETMYKEGESSGVNDEKKGLLQGDDFTSCDHPLADPLA